MSLKADRREWNDLAREDAMWAVHSDPERRGSWTADAFFASGEAPGGVIVFQLPTRVGWQIRLHPLRLVNRGLRVLPWSPRWALRLVMGHSMRLVGLPEAEVRSILDGCGAPVGAAAADRRTGTDVAPSMTYVAVRAGA